MDSLDVDKDFYTVVEFANKLGVHSNTVRKGIDRGRIQAVDVGSGNKRLFRIPKSEIERISLFSLERVVEKIIEKRAKEKQNGSI